MNYRRRIKKLLLPAITLVILSIWGIPALDAQQTNNPSSRLYRYLNQWEGAGYIRRLPPIQPYSPQLVTELLREVATSAPERERRIAEEFLRDFDTTVNLHFTPVHESRSELGSEYFGLTGLDMEGTAFFSDIVALSGNWGLHLIDKQKGAQIAQGSPGSREDIQTGMALPYWQYSPRDLVGDSSVFEVADREFQILQSITTDLSLGTPEIYFQAGQMRTAFGPFWENSGVIGRQAPHAVRYNLIWRNDFFNYYMMLLELTATDDEGLGRDPNKHMVFHGINFRVTENLELGMFESVIYGGRFEPVYLLPVGQLTYQQFLVGVGDNSLIGFTADYRLFDNIKLAGQIFIDDLGFSDMAEFDFDTKYKLAFQTGISWTPLSNIFREISFDYLLAAPYMYTHKPEDRSEPNYQNYTHDGYSLGAGLDPNSDRFSLRAALMPAYPIELDLAARLIRHGNASEDEGSLASIGDGSIFDDGYSSSGGATFNDSTEFLTQSVIEYIWQAGGDVSVARRLGPGEIEASFGYTFEYVANADLVAGKNEINNYLGIQAAYRF
ncbi:MAG: hypothetical protein K9L68_01150 [Spirochaetales bacterium]|nr:hypothetical protein [Spirochaetales bacterium]MCF7937183.1 hypothetical protein [Spirochaetales bacterium]